MENINKKTACELVVEYNFFDSHEDRSSFLDANGFSGLKTLFSMRAFLFGPFAYIFSGMYLVGVWWIATIFLVSLLCQTIEHVLAYPFVIAQINFLPLWWLMVIAGMVAILMRYAVAHTARMALYVIVFYILMIVSTLLTIFLYVALSAVLHFVFNIKLASEIVQYIREAAPANVAIAFLYTIDRCKKMVTQSR